MDREAWWVTVHGVTKESDMTEQLNTNHWLSKSGRKRRFSLLESAAGGHDKTEKQTKRENQIQGSILHERKNV